MHPRLLILGAAVVVLLLLPGAEAHRSSDSHGANANSNTQTWVVGTYTITIGSDLTTLTIDGTIGVNKITPTGGATETASDIRTAYNGAGSDAAKDTVMNRYRTKLKEQMDTQFAAMFPGRTPTYLRTDSDTACPQPNSASTCTPREQTSSLGGTATGPVNFLVRVRITLDPTAEGLGSYDSQDIEAVLRSGAGVRVTRSFTSDAGHENTYTLVAPSFGSFTAATAPATVSSGRVTVSVDAADSTTSVSTSALPLTIQDTTATPPTAESVTIRTRVQMEEFLALPGECPILGTCYLEGLPMTVTVTVEIGSIDRTKKMSGMSIPSAVTLPTFFSADAIRRFATTGVVASADLTEAETTLRNQIRDDVDASFATRLPTRGTAPITVTTTSALSAGVSEATGSPVTIPFNSVPAIPYSASVNRIFYDIGAESNTADAAFDVGAIAFFNVTLEEGADREQTYTILPPPDLAYMNLTAPVAGAGLTFEVPNDTRSRRVQIQLGNPSVDRFNQETILNFVTVTLADMEGVKDENLPVDIGISTEVYAIGVVKRFPDVLPTTVKLSYLGADGVRYLKQRGIIGDSDLDGAETQIVSETRSNLESAFAGPVTTSGGFSDASLAPDAPDAWPLWFNMTGASAHDLGEVPDRADAALETGAIVNSTFDFTSQAGQKTTYTLRLSGGLLFFEGRTPAGSSFTKQVDNLNGTETKKEATSVRIGADVERPDRADMRTKVIIEIEKFRQNVSGLPIRIDVEALLYAMDVEERFGDTLPDTVELDFLSGDGLRTLYRRGVITDAELDNATANLQDDITARLRDAFGEKVNVTARFDRATLTGERDGRPVRMTAIGIAIRDLGGADPRAAEIIFEAGATVTLDQNLTGMKSVNLTYTISLPETLRFLNVTGATLDTPRQLRVPIEGWNQSEEVRVPVRFELRHPNAPNYTAPQVKIVLNIDLELELEMLKLIQERDGKMLMGIDARIELGVLEVPDELGGEIPKEVKIKYLPADALRRMWKVGLLKEENLTEIETQFLKQVKDGLKAIAGEGVNVTGGIDRSQFDLAVSSPLSGDNPIVLTAKARFTKSLLEASSGGVIALAEIPLNLPLKSFEGYPTTYTVVLPRGLEPTTVGESEGATISQGETPAGRSFVSFAVEGGKEITTNMKIAVTPALLIEHFLPWLILALLLVLGILLAPVILIVRLVSKSKEKEKQAQLKAKKP